MHRLWSLVVAFAIIGIGAYGGGLVTVPLIDHELVDTRHFLGENELARLVAIAQMTPGPIAVNAATFVGYRVAGLGGGLLATVAVLLPAIAILTALGYVPVAKLSRARLLYLRRGLRAGVFSLLLFAIWSYGRIVITGPAELCMAACAFLVLTAFEGKVHPLFVIGGLGVVGLLLF